MYFELSHFGIGVKTLVPGFIKTNLVNSADIAQIRGVSPKMLSQSLRQLEERGLIRRQVYPEVPPRVEYSLTEMGQSLAPLLVELCDWSVEWEAREPALPASPGPVVLVAGSAVSQPSKMRAEKG